MMGLTWLLLGIFTAGAVILYRELSNRYHLTWLHLSSYGGGIVLLLFSVAWSVGAVLEGVPRAGSMGMLLFGLPVLILKFQTHENLTLVVPEASKIDAPHGRSNHIGHFTRRKPVLSGPLSIHNDMHFLFSRFRIGSDIFQTGYPG